VKSLRFIPFLLVILLLQHYTWVSPQTRVPPRSNTSEVGDVSLVPQKAYEVLKIARETGRAPEGYVGGRVFQNREHRLPEDGDYREFDVDPHEGYRNAERIIVEWGTKKAWYTDDHYQTFIPMP